ncbi:MAG: nicotinate phosphoribosyltransferase [Desulfobacterales bacterium]|nr:nicotinate phosphoribosyltransferase [Desulfobacterales bacterium]
MIIPSLLDTDLYKLTMMQAVLHHFPWAMVEYEFTCRNEHVDFRLIADDIQKEIYDLCQMRFTPKELDYLRSLRFIKEDFVQFLRLFQFNPEFVCIKNDADGFALTIKGPWLHTILFEVPVLAIVSELYYAKCQPEPDFTLGRNKLKAKIQLVQESNQSDLNFLFSDFGTRRRFSYRWQAEIVDALVQQLPDHFWGTSNVHFAMKHHIRPVGTMAHEWLMGCQALGPKLVNSQRFALEHWAHEYRGDLGIALSDVVGFEAFLNDFDLYFAKLFDGCRHDSGDPLIWGNRLLSHYAKFNIDPRTKIAVFSDGLTFPKAIDLARHFKGKIKTSFGIGTNLTNDISSTPIQIVIKMTHCQGTPVAKISDSPGKQMCKEQGYLDYLFHVFQNKTESFASEHYIDSKFSGIGME